MTRALPWIIALLISLIANGVMTGLVLHQFVGAPRLENVLPQDDFRPPPPRQGDGRQGGRGFNIRAFMRNLPEEQREIARVRFDAERDIIRGLMEDVRDAQWAAARAMEASPYDPIAAADALNELRERRFAIESAFEAIVLDVIADLPADERLRAMEAGRRGPPPGPRGRGEGRRGPPPRERF